jgi:hypothetical protein
VSCGLRLEKGEVLHHGWLQKQQPGLGLGLLGFQRRLFLLTATHLLY